MSRFALRALPLLLLYLATLGSVAAGDIVVGGVLALAVAATVRPVLPPAAAPPLPLRRRTIAAVAEHVITLGVVVRGAWRMAPYCLTGRPPPHAGIVEVPVDDRSAAAIAGWGIRTTLSPDELVVDVDRERGVLLVHVLDASDPDAVRARHHADRQRQRRYLR